MVEAVVSISGAKEENSASSLPAHGLSHPALPLMQKFLQASVDARADGQPLLAATAIETAKGLTEGKGTGKGYDQSSLPIAAIDNLPPLVVEGLSGLWIAIANEKQSLGMEEVEELVLAHLCEYPAFLAKVLLEAPLHQVGLGQSLMGPGSRVDMAEVERRLRPNLERHSETAAKVAAEACSHLLGRSETLACKLFSRMDLDQDGFISRDEFLRAAPHALAIEVENVAIGAGVQALLTDPDYSDDFHTAMAGAMGIVP